MIFYVGSPASVMEQTKEIIHTIRQVGHTISFDWTHPKADGGQGDVRVSWRDDPDAARAHAIAERSAIKSSEVVVLNLPPDPVGAGCFWEAGMATGLCMYEHKVVWILNYERYPRDLVFFYLPECHFLSLKREFPAALLLCKASEIEDPEARAREVERVCDFYTDRFGAEFPDYIQHPQRESAVRWVT